MGGAGTVRRPLLDVYLDAARLVPQTCLVDTGAAAIRLSAELARAAGVALPPEPNRPDIVVGAVRSQVVASTVELALELGEGTVTWTTEATFCDPWPHPFGLLGLRGFFDAFDVDFRGRDEAFSLTVR